MVELMTPAVQAAGLVVASGQVGLIRGSRPEGGFPAEVRQALKSLEAVLGQQSVGLKDLFKVNVYLTDISDFSAMNEIYSEFFPESPPARTTVAIAALPAGARIEVEGWALADAAAKPAVSKAPQR